MKIEPLVFLHRSMRVLNIQIDVFNYEYNNVQCSVMFDVSSPRGYSLTFIKNGFGEILDLPIIPSYNLQITNSNFEKFWNFFNLGFKKKGEFSIKDFFIHLSNHIPTTATPYTYQARQTIALKYPVEESEKIYISGTKNWEKARALNPLLKKERSEKNLEKTKLLYPEVYNLTRDYDISICYSPVPSIDDNNLINRITLDLE